MTWMMTVRSMPLAFMRERRVSGSASRAGTLAPWAKGKAGSWRQTWTWGSRMRYFGCARAVMAAPVIKVRRVMLGQPPGEPAPFAPLARSDIDGLQFFYDVLAAALVAGSRALAGDVEVDAEPAFEVDALEHAMAGGKVDVAVAEV